MVMILMCPTADGRSEGTPTSWLLGRNWTAQPDLGVPLGFLVACIVRYLGRLNSTWSSKGGADTGGISSVIQRGMYILIMRYVGIYVSDLG